jgi:hypothetical protein
MAKEAFIEKKFRPESLVVIVQANEIIEEYRAQGYLLTLRQLYYQFVARALIENTQRSYKRLGGLISDGRLAGLIDWDSIEDRTRNREKNLHLRDPQHAVELIRDQYSIDMWANQESRVEVWIEKEALTGVIEATCRELDLPYFACRGYVSQSEQYSAGVRARSTYNRDTQWTIILHFGDHDPSGIDMTRDNTDRLKMFAGWRGAPEIRRLALNRAQIDEYDPPPNFAKQTDSRFAEYEAIHGDLSWELDALEPAVINQLIRDEIEDIRDPDLWKEKEVELALGLATLEDVAERLGSGDEDE